MKLHVDPKIVDGHVEERFVSFGKLEKDICGCTVRYFVQNSIICVTLKMAMFEKSSKKAVSEGLLFFGGIKC